MKIISQKILDFAKIVILGLVIGFGVNYLSAAWTAPSTTPPGGNVDAPINVGYTSQLKQGNLDIKGLVSAGVSAVNGLIVENGNVGFGTITPGAKLEVNGQVKITGGSPGDGKVLTSDASGLASWQAISAGSCTNAPQSMTVDTVYQNNSGNQILVTASTNATGSNPSLNGFVADTQAGLSVDDTFSNTALVGSESGGSRGSLSFLVPNGKWYKITLTNSSAIVKATYTVICGGSGGGTSGGGSNVAPGTLLGWCDQSNGALPPGCRSGAIEPAYCSGSGVGSSCECRTGYTKVWTGGCGWGSCGAQGEHYFYSCAKQ